MAINAVARVTVDLHMDNDIVMNLAEGDIVRGLKYRVSGKIYCIDGAVRVINGVTKMKSANSKECVHDPYLHEYITVQSIVIDSSNEFDAELTTVQISSIISIETIEKNAGDIVVGTGAQFKPLTQIIAEASAGSTIRLESGVYDAPLTLDKDISIVGDGTVDLVGPIVIGKATATASDDGDTGSAPKVHLEGLTMTDSATIEIKEADAFTMIGCTFGGHSMTKTTQPIHFTSDHPCMVIIENNTFFEENEFSYNLINVYATLKDGSSISDNKFEKGCCTHNNISLYNVENRATLAINNNYCVESKNMLRVGFHGEPECTIIMEGNRYDVTDTQYPEYAGMFLLQPAGTRTTSFANLTIDITDTTKPDGQIGYLYIGANDTHLTEDQYPTVVVDGVKVAIPVYGVQVNVEPETENEATDAV